MNIPVDVHIPERYGVNTGREFDNESEVHHFGLLVKVVDPGCTAELQIEERSGRVTRITTTDDSKTDRSIMRKEVLLAFDRLLDKFEI